MNLPKNLMKRNGQQEIIFYSVLFFLFFGLSLIFPATSYAKIFQLLDKSVFKESEKSSIMIRPTFIDYTTSLILYVSNGDNPETWTYEPETIGFGYFLFTDYFSFGSPVGRYVLVEYKNDKQMFSCYGLPKDECIANPHFVSEFDINIVSDNTVIAPVVPTPTPVGDITPTPEPNPIDILAPLLNILKPDTVSPTEQTPTSEAVPPTEEKPPSEVIPPTEISPPVETEPPAEVTPPAETIPSSDTESTQPLFDVISEAIIQTSGGGNVPVLIAVLSIIVGTLFVIFLILIVKIIKTKRSSHQK